MVHTRFLLVAALGLAIAACSDSQKPSGDHAGSEHTDHADEDAGDDGDGGPRSLCATCKPLDPVDDVEGGDDSEEFPICTTRRVEVERDDTSLGFTPSEVLAFVEGEFTVPMRWGLPDFLDPSVRDTPLWPTGFDEDTRVRLDVHANAIHVLDLEPIDDSVAPESCVDALEIDARVSVETEDGALRGTFEHVSLYATTVHFAQGEAQAPLRDFEGTLDLHPTKSPHDGQVFLRSLFRRDSVRGELMPRLNYVEYTEDQLNAHGFEGFWPVDGCPPDAWLVDPKQELAEFGGRRLSELLDDASERMMRANPLAAEWGRKGVDVTVTLGTPGRACGAGSTMHVETTFRVETSDARLNTELSGSLQIDMDSDGAVKAAALQSYDHVPANEFADKFDFSGLDFGEWPCAQLRCEAQYFEASPLPDDTGEGPLNFGHIEVDGVMCSDKFGVDGHTVAFVAWCNRYPCPFTNEPRL